MGDGLAAAGTSVTRLGGGGGSSFSNDMMLDVFRSTGRGGAGAATGLGVGAGAGIDMGMFLGMAMAMDTGTGVRVGAGGGAGTAGVVGCVGGVLNGSPTSDMGRDNVERGRAGAGGEEMWSFSKPRPGCCPNGPC